MLLLPFGRDTMQKCMYGVIHIAPLCVDLLKHCFDGGLDVFGLGSGGETLYLGAIA